MAESAGTHKDPVTGELISKTCVHFLLLPRTRLTYLARPSELKRREKARKIEAAKAEKAAAAPAKATTAVKSSAADEENLSPNVRPLNPSLHPPFSRDVIAIL